MRWFPSRWCVLAAVTALAASGCKPRDAPPTTEPSARAAATATASKSAPSARVHEYEVLSQVYHVDDIYKSMRGPQSTEHVALRPGAPAELLWIVGFEAVMVDPTSHKQLSQEFMCHTNLDIDPVKHGALFAGNKRISGRLFTLSQGQYRIDLPAGFGLPILSSEVMDLNTQVLNLNVPDIKRNVRHRIVMRYVRDRELTTPMKALYSAGAYGLKLLTGQDGHYGRHSQQQPAAANAAAAKAPDHAHQHSAAAVNEAPEHGPGCLPGENAGHNVFDDNEGREFTGHWVVKPGREVNHTRVTQLMDLPFDTTLHYVAVHLHPFGESLELRDLTTGKRVYKAYTRQAKQGLGLAHVDFYSSQEGIPLFKDHEYEIISVYNNTSGEDQDSMAVMNMYVLDKEFRKPNLENLRNPPAATRASAAPAASAAPTTDE